MDKRIASLETEYGLYVLDQEFDRNFNYVIARSIIENLDGMCPLRPIDIHRKFLDNGGQAYVDQGHAEISLPECPTPLDVVRYDHASSRMLDDSSKHLPYKVKLYKLNRDSQNNSFGCHENYYLPREDVLIKMHNPQIRHFLADRIMAFLVTRTYFTGSGHYIPGEGYHLSQRADFMHADVGEMTTRQRPLMHWKEEHFSSQGYRIHLICGDSNMADWSNYLKVGLTNIVLRMAIHGFLDDAPKLISSIHAMQTVSQDLKCKASLRIKGGRIFGRKMKAVKVLRYYYHKMQEFFMKFRPDFYDVDLLEKFRFVIEGLREPRSLDRHLDAWIKLSLIDGKSEELKQNINMQYHSCHPNDLFYGLRQEKLENLVDDAEIDLARINAPDSRAHWRVIMMRLLRPNIIEKASWDIIKSKEITVHIKEPYSEIPKNLNRKPF